MHFTTITYIIHYVLVITGALLTVRPRDKIMDFIANTIISLKLSSSCRKNRQHVDYHLSKWYWVAIFKLHVPAPH